MVARFDGKIVLVTGGAGGIARVTAAAFAREGALVVVSGRNADALTEVVREITDAGGRADHVVADVSDPESAARMVATVVERHGGLHVACNAAGILGEAAPLADVAVETWSQVLAVNLTGVFLSMKHEIAHMREHGGGAVVNIGSNIGTQQRLPGVGAYAASKAGVSVLSRAAAREHIADGVRINVVSPGGTDTSMSYLPGEDRAARDARFAASVPSGRVSTPAEVAAAVLWLASDDSAHVIGHELVIDGGATA
ncbi:NAD(P)-dependent dehydrogenase, short-chain alcohol dehydrogenase family [Saccharopolyspora antimicrobica]|uniref:NAD(P)-dependent dehydrogenase (Short-subunit alcohol dehydrogenase family) n=1 Tax=Saccharopolyspora antimicrobica TaxID=455193 RepID=A0A1I4TQB5_9PSEU|nr:SDR family oxidoreductase [Saccharopolyspora antimicrobica]RKT88501.1 NAD(P)-dependent dehydrogenase (short-subunit alcohol dehydrogenase family) [Saccharopolyspora antimicrobica]SFM78727.1 NAD(P)-dependent dehydrogenase, short-chain alcohol dehydrogenase family [Saccharopolyspora antimicrobica]